MSKKTRFLSLFLALLMTASLFVSCAANPGEEENSEDTTAVSTEVTTDPVEEALSALRSEVDWGGKEFGILYVNDIGGYIEEVEAEKDSGDESSSGVINDAVFERNTLFEEYCHLTFSLLPSSNGSISGTLSSGVSSGTEDFHVVVQTTSGTANAATSGYLYNFLDLDIDYNQEWWDAGTLSFALDGRVFFMDGPFNIVDDDVTFVFMFNKDLRTEYKIENPYDTVRDGEWTLDYFNSVIKTLASDSNGDGKWDEKDTYGFSTPGSIGNTFFYGAGLQYVVNDSEMDAPELVLSTKMEQALNVLEIARSIVHENNSSYVAKAGDEAISKDIFVQGRSLFYCEAASYLRALNSTMEREYGVVPVPKYDKAQEHYTTWRHSIGSTLSIPTSTAKNDMDQFAKVLEVYCLLSQRLVRPAYYEVMLTTRNVQDVESSDMLDLIFQHRTYDMAMYFDTLGFSNLFANAVITSGSNFSSAYKSASKTFDGKIARLLKKLQKG